MKLRNILNIALASLMLASTVPTLQANPAAAQPGDSFRSMITPLTLGMFALTYIGMNAHYWQKVNDRPTATRWDKLRQAQQNDIAGWYNYASNSLRWFRNEFRSFFGLVSFDQGEGYAPENFDVRTHAQKQQEQEDAELARRLQNEQNQRAHGARANARRPANARPAARR